MFCPNCGKAEQTENAYCRQCGEFIPDLKALTSLSFGGITPLQNARSISILSLIACIVSLLVGILMYATKFNVPFVLYLAAAILICNAFWHLSNFYVVRKLARKINPKQSSEAAPNILETGSDAAQNLLPPAETNEFITPNSVTENTTRKLKVKKKM